MQRWHWKKTKMKTWHHPYYFASSTVFHSHPCLLHLLFVPKSQTPSTLPHEVLHLTFHFSQRSFISFVALDKKEEREIWRKSTVDDKKWSKRDLHKFKRCNAHELRECSSQNKKKNRIRKESRNYLLWSKRAMRGKRLQRGKRDHEQQKFTERHSRCVQGVK